MFSLSESVANYDCGLNSVAPSLLASANDCAITHCLSRHFILIEIICGNQTKLLSNLSLGEIHQLNLKNESTENFFRVKVN